ncbi:hypothetical protein [Virgibacillus halodenitrificans]|uniref:hypothetical protein n=1 Tax=Virgibacillus halodenitrificans TaxID=1482 RepID=UPI002DBC516E|nr:hypothetical protein [Virgibacillus halodenitrificans]MEC2159383.1 hypothetical protein [Virgibacillus halodenitrificans]
MRKICFYHSVTFILKVYLTIKYIQQHLIPISFDGKSKWIGWLLIHNQPLINHGRSHQWHPGFMDLMKLMYVYMVVLMAGSLNYFTCAVGSSEVIHKIEHMTESKRRINRLLNRFILPL